MRGAVLRILNFKSIKDIQMELRPVTILLGPPASGKSNILDGIAIAGWIGRLKLLEAEYGSLQAVEPLSQLARYTSVDNVFRYFDLTSTVTIGLKFSIASSSQQTLHVNIKYENGKPRIYINNKFDDVLSNLLVGRTPPYSPRLPGSLADIPLFDARVYGFERYGLSLSRCINSLCGFYRLLTGSGEAGERKVPTSVLSELGWNARLVIKSVPSVIRDINNYLKEKLDESIEIKVLRDGRIVIFDYEFEITGSNVSDGVIRMIYYLTALSTARNYAKKRGLEGRLIVALEEPETHVFPFLLELLVEYIVKTSRDALVVVSTHNPLFASRLADRASDAAVYYVYRAPPERSTQAALLSLERLARELATIEDVLALSPREVVKKYVVETKSAEAAT